MRPNRGLAALPRGAATLFVALGLGLAAGAAAAPRPTILLLVTERVMGVFGTTGYEQPRHAEARLAAALDARGFAVVDLQAVERVAGRARARQLLEGDDAVAREVALQQEAQYLLVGTALSKPAGGKLYGSELQSLQGSVTVRLLRSDDGRVLQAASAQAAQAHLDEVQGGMLAIGKAADGVLEQLAPALQSLLGGSGGASAEPADVALHVEGLVSFRHLDYLMGHLESAVASIAGARLRSFHGGVADVALSTHDGAEGVARALGNAAFTGFRLRVTHVSPQRVEVEVVLDEP